jgi:hypothetical protein
MSAPSRERADGRQPAGDNNVEHRQNEAERYRQAADDAMQQLDWCIGYLHGIRKVKISRALAQNRNVIRKHLLHRPQEPLPTSYTGE